MLALLLAIACAEVQRDDPKPHEHTTTTTVPRNIDPLWLSASWHASSWSDCTYCSFGHVQIRSVKCVDIWREAVLADEHCGNLRRPPMTKPCSCAETPCHGDRALCPASQDEEWFEAQSPYVELGCFHLLEPYHKHKGDVFDFTCLHAKGVCKSGLPFFSMSSNAMSPALCFSFCTNKGMDIVGLVHALECRCGMSALNRNGRLRGPLDPALLFSLARLKPYHVGAGVCPMRVFRYSGYFAAGGLPTAMLKMDENDVDYIRQIYGHHKEAFSEDDVLTPSPRPLMHGGATTPQPWDRPCYPSSCGKGQVWPERVSRAPRGVFHQFHEYTVVPYFFAPDINDARKEVFRKACRRWHEVTCVVLLEKDEEEIDGPAVKVVMDDPDGCWVNRVGYPGYWAGQARMVEVNLGWCNNMLMLGNLMHEIGHAIGMNHEQKRLDATKSVQQGPYLHVFWKHMEQDARKRFQYTPDSKSYMGSNLQDDTDPHHGYADYDYSSIMHYGRTGFFEPMHSENAELLGNRDHLSMSDISQVNDMYQCKELASMVSLSCDFEVDFCNWRNVGEDSSQWLLESRLNRGAYADAKDHPWEAFILESPALSSSSDYDLTFSYFLSSHATRFSVEYQSVLGKSVKIFSATAESKEWHTETLRVHGQDAVTVRFVLLATEDADSGAGVDDMQLTTVAQAHHSAEHSENMLRQAVDAFKNLLDSIFKKYERHERRSAGVPVVPLAALSLVAVGILGAAVRRFRSPSEWEPVSVKDCSGFSEVA